MSVALKFPTVAKTLGPPLTVTVLITNRQSSRTWLQPAVAVAAAAAAAGSVGTARADEVATIHPEAKVCALHGALFPASPATNFLLDFCPICIAVLADSAFVNPSKDLLQV